MSGHPSSPRCLASLSLCPLGWRGEQPDRPSTEGFAWKQVWLTRWQTNQTGWHERAVNPLLTAHFPSLNVPPGGRIFVPLCGKSLDLGLLLPHGYAVAGAELSEDDLHRHYSGNYPLKLLAPLEVPGGLKGKYPATEHIWRLTK
ncbi:MAG: hypothetical protein KA240_06805 [Nitrospira sp.]|nr:hypothetical protein [Nitrospira sp.]MBP6605377.1 hypothetical protein [Nitrospira sp.]HQY59143.1 hypothetical protein [Nitrospira sp.]HRA96591.1 hypothetical protein [Nitrospira sp.]